MRKTIINLVCLMAPEGNGGIKTRRHFLRPEIRDEIREIENRLAELKSFILAGASIKILQSIKTTHGDEYSSAADKLLSANLRELGEKTKTVYEKFFSPNTLQSKYAQLSRRNNRRKKMNLAFIPVRGGSKSIPLKNIKKINGRPLVYWTAKAANDSANIEKVVVATDSADIKRAVQGFGLPEVSVYDRKPENATDTASTESAMPEYIEAAHPAPGG
jgi:hypothetical protein